MNRAYKIINVPLIDIAILSNVDKWGDELNGYRTLRAKWDDSTLSKLALWIYRHNERISHLIEDGIRQNQSDTVSGVFKPNYKLEHKLRNTLDETARLDCLSHDRIIALIRDRKLLRVLKILAKLVGVNPQLRTSDVGTEPDARGVSLRYPRHALIHDQLLRFQEWLIRYMDCSDACAIISFNVIVNIHPFSDGNGRIARLLFHILSRHMSHNQFTIPLYELSIISRGGLIVRQRIAQYENNWKPLLTFLDDSSLYFLRTLFGDS